MSAGVCCERNTASSFSLWLLSVVRQDVAGALQQVVSEEEPAERMLNTPTHLHEVLQDVLPRLWEGPHVHDAHRDQQISGGERSRAQRFDGGLGAQIIKLN